MNVLIWLFQELYLQCCRHANRHPWLCLPFAICAMAFLLRLNQCLDTFCARTQQQAACIHDSQYNQISKPDDPDACAAAKFSSAHHCCGCSCPNHKGIFPIDSKPLSSALSIHRMLLSADRYSLCVYSKALAVLEVTSGAFYYNWYTYTQCAGYVVVG